MAAQSRTPEHNRQRHIVSFSNKRSPRADSRGMDEFNANEVLEFEYGVRAYAPHQPGGYWRLRWEEHHRRRDTTAKGREEAIAKATEIVERLACGTDTDLVTARGADLVAHYLDPRRRPARVKEWWSERMREERARYCEKYVLAVIADVRCRQLGRADFQRILGQARTASVARQLRRTITGLVNAGLIEGCLLPCHDVLRGERWLPADGAYVAVEPGSRAITPDEIPNTDDTAATSGTPPPRGWPKKSDGDGWHWTFHSLRHVFATWALSPTRHSRRRRLPAHGPLVVHPRHARDLRTHRRRRVRPVLQSHQLNAGPGGRSPAS
jgi:hypothetical protein